VWASKYNDRAFVSTRKVGISFDDVRMAVLCQRVVPAQVGRRPKPSLHGCAAYPAAAAVRLTQSRVSLA
jgi:hypothetical protein